MLQKNSPGTFTTIDLFLYKFVIIHVIEIVCSRVSICSVFLFVIFHVSVKH